MYMMGQNLSKSHNNNFSKLFLLKYVFVSKLINISFSNFLNDMGWEFASPMLECWVLSSYCVGSNKKKVIKFV